ncbi:MAG: DUF4129 domain-containing protein [Bacteroidia bacterium]
MRFLIIYIFIFSRLALATAQTEAVEEAAYPEQLPEPKALVVQESKLIENLDSIQINSSAFDSAIWKKHTNGLDYFEVDEAKPVQKKKQAEKEEDTEEAPSHFVGISQVLLIIIIVAVLGFLIYQIVRQLRKKDVNIEEDEFWQINLNQSDKAEIQIEDKLRFATESEDYIIAIRLNYLLALNELNRNGIVKWKKDKTNQDYIKELKGTDFHANFRKLTSIFERAWFGRFRPDSVSYKEISELFRTYIDGVKTYSSKAGKA